MNIVILSGNLTRDVEIRRTQDDILIAVGSIAIAREFSKKKETDYINFTAIGQSAEYLSKYGRKGCRAEIVGSWRHSQYEKMDGKKAYKDECIVERINVISKVLNSDKPIDNKESEKPQDIADDDLPF